MSSTKLVLIAHIIRPLKNCYIYIWKEINFCFNCYHYKTLPVHNFTCMKPNLSHVSKDVQFTHQSFFLITINFFEPESGNFLVKESCRFLCLYIDVNISLISNVYCYYREFYWNFFHLVIDEIAISPVYKVHEMHFTRSWSWQEFWCTSQICILLLIPT